jgi:hypothetical protein
MKQNDSPRSLKTVFENPTIRWASVCLFYIGLAVVFTWPLVLRMGSSLTGQIGDNIYFVWMIGWMKRALFELHVNPFNVWFLNYPEGWNMAYTEITPAMLALALPFSIIGSPTFAYNATMLLAFALSGISMYIWIRHLTGKDGAALVAGMIFAALPYRMAHFLIGHLNLSGTMWLPLYFMGFFDLLTLAKNDDSEKASGKKSLWAGIPWKPAVITGVFLGLTGLTSQYYLYMALIVSAILAAIYLIFYRRSQLRNVRFWKGMVAAGVVMLPLVLLAVLPYLNLSRSGGLPDRNISIVRMYSASPTDFLLPSTDHFLWGRWIGSHFNRDMWVEGTLYIGVVSLGLLAIALIRRKKITSQMKITLPVSLLVCGAAFATLLAMGTDFHWLGQSISLPVPGFVQGVLHRTELPLVLPGYFLFQYFPFFAKLRALMRFGVFTLVFCTAAAGLGAAWLLERLTGPSGSAPANVLHLPAALTALLLILVFIDFYPGPYTEFAQVKTRPVDTWLAQQPGDGAVIQFPFIQGEDQDQTYNTLIHQKPFVGGFFNAFPPAQYTRVKPIMEKFPDPESIAMLPELGVEYVLVDADEYPDVQALKSTLAGHGLHFATQLDDQLVFTLDR